MQFAPDAIHTGWAHAPVLQVDEGGVDELLAEGDMALTTIVFEKEFLQAVNVMTVTRFFLIKQTHFVSVALPGKRIGLGKITGEYMEDEEAAHTELKSFPGLAFESDTATGCQGMVVAQARTVIRCAEKAAEMAMKLTSLEEVNQRIRIALLVLMPAPQGRFLVYILVLCMEVFSCRKQQEDKSDAKRSMRLVHWCS
jgi:hypothetical protein